MERAWPTHGRRRNLSVAERFWEKVEKTDGCWIWRGARQKQGYGVIAVEGKAERANRIVWTLMGDPLSPSETSLHRCDNPPCVNPAHLFRGSFVENAVDMVSKGRDARRPITPQTRARMIAGRAIWQDSNRRTHCMKGHAYTPENTIQTSSGKRRCRICGRANLRATEERRALDPARAAHRNAKQLEYGARYRERQRGT